MKTPLLPIFLLLAGVASAQPATWSVAHSNGSVHTTAVENPKPQAARVATAPAAARVAATATPSQPAPAAAARLTPLWDRTTAQVRSRGWRPPVGGTFSLETPLVLPAAATETAAAPTAPAAQDQDWVRLYPNPAQASVTIACTQPLQVLHLRDLQGRTVRTQSALPEGQHALSLSQLSAGIYHWEARLASGARTNGKLVVQ